MKAKYLLFLAFLFWVKLVAGTCTKSSIFTYSVKVIGAQVSVACSTKSSTSSGIMNYVTNRIWTATDCEKQDFISGADFSYDLTGSKEITITCVETWNTGTCFEDAQTFIITPGSTSPDQQIPPPEIPDNVEDGECVSSILPQITVDVALRKTDATFTIKDISNTSVKSQYYNFEVKLHCRNNLNNNEEIINFPKYNENKLGYTMHTVNRPGPYLGIDYYFFLEVGCNSRGTKILSRVTSDVVTKTLLPGDFDSTQNYKNISGEGGNITIDTYTNSCGSTLWSNPNNPVDDLPWITDISVKRFIKFTAKPNTTLQDRVVKIQLSVAGNYDKCLPVVNGQRLNYRTIIRRQPSIFTDVKSPSAVNIPLPYDAQGSAYYQINGKYYYNEISTTDINNALFNNFITIYRYSNDNNKLINSKKVSVYVAMCTPFLFSALTNFMPSIADSFDMYISRGSSSQTIDNYTVRSNTSLVVTSPSSVTLTNFSTADNAVFEGYISECTDMKSYKETDSNEMYPASAVKEEPVQMQVVAPAVKDSVQNGYAVLVYPNPNNGIFTIDFQNCKETILGIEIVDSKGQIISRPSYKNESQLQVNLKGFASGCYTVRVQTTSGSMIRKLTIE